MSERDTRWWTLGEVVGWVRGIHPTATIGEIRGALQGWCASDRIRAHGRRRLYSSDRPLPMDHHDPNFIWFADHHSRLQPWFEPISADEWKDLTFFARPILKTGEQYHQAVARALDQLDSAVELRSLSKYRLAWKDIEFLQDDVIRGWAGAGDVARQDDATREPLFDAAGRPTAGTARSRLLTKGASQLSDRDLHMWYDRRVTELRARGETSSGEADWEAARQQLSGRVTRARLRAVRDELAPAGWRKQGRRSPGIAK